MLSQIPLSLCTEFCLRQRYTDITKSYQVWKHSPDTLLLWHHVTKTDKQANDSVYTYNKNNLCSCLEGWAFM